jgi:hypothetical protein
MEREEVFIETTLFSLGITPERVAGISDAVLRSSNTRNIRLSSRCFRVSSAAGGESLRATGCGYASQMDTPETINPRRQKSDFLSDQDCAKLLKKLGEMKNE